jgi:regulatory protein
MSAEAATRLRNSALRLLARREHSSRELAGKLASRHALPASSPEIDTLLSDLQASGYLSDVRFVESFIRERRNRGYGPARIEQELRLRGVESDMVDQYLDHNDPLWIDVAQTVRRKRFGDNPPALLKDKARISRFLQYRGFLSEQIRQAL